MNILVAVVDYMRKENEMQHRIHLCELLFLFIILLLVQFAFSIKKGRGKAPRWWGLAHPGKMTNSVFDQRQSNSIIGGGYNRINIPLRKKQRRLVRDNPGVLMAISKGMKIAINECQFQFKDRKWNCPTTSYMKGKGVFGKIVQRGCRETAFIYAITSAGVAHSVARACREGIIETCTCDYRNNRKPNGFDWEWGGCSDNIEFGYKFARSFVDAAEKGRDLRYITNLHNNEAGRLTVKNHMRTVCKCHGMSGSCTLKTCWRKLPIFRNVGNRLKAKFDGAAKVMAGNHGKNFIPEGDTIKFPGKEDLVYSEESPTFCEADRKTGSLGTRGRECNHTSMGVDGCELLCCGRGYVSQRKVERVNCRCRFQWCCEVICDTCIQKRTIHKCL